MTESTQDKRRFSFYLRALRELGQSLSDMPCDTRSSDVLHESLYRIMGTFALSRGCLFFLDHVDHHLKLVSQKGLPDNFDLSVNIPERVAYRMSSLESPFHPQLPPGEAAKLDENFRKAVIDAQMAWIVPLCDGGNLLGLICISNRVDGDVLNELELEFVSEMACQIAHHIKDSRTRRELADRVNELQALNQNLSSIYLETLRTLAMVIDGPEVTDGASHSQRVAALAAEIGRKLGLEPNSCDRLYVAGLLHDIGKQLINRKVLDKPSGLTAVERREIESHSLAGWEIISHLNFPWGDVARIIRHHHERLDGQGYPDNLSGEQISIDAKILMLTEAFDSMTSEQPWRPRLSFDKIVEQIQNDLGIRFEPRVVEALCEVVEEGLDGKIKNDEFVPNLTSGFDAELIRRLLGELREQLRHPTTRPSAKIVSVDDVARENSS